MYRLSEPAAARFTMSIPRALEALGLVELEHNARNSRVRATPA